MAEYRPPVSGINEPKDLRAVQRNVARVLDFVGGELLGPHQDVWAEVVPKNGDLSARVTLLDSARYGFHDLATVEIRNLQTPTPRYIATPAVSSEETMNQYDITDPARQLQVAKAIAAIVETGTRRSVGTLDL